MLCAAPWTWLEVQEKEVVPASEKRLSTPPSSTTRRPICTVASARRIGTVKDWSAAGLVFAGRPVMVATSVPAHAFWSLGIRYVTSFQCRLVVAVTVAVPELDKLRVAVKELSFWVLAEIRLSAVTLPEAVMAAAVSVPVV